MATGMAIVLAAATLKSLDSICRTKRVSRDMAISRILVWFSKQHPDVRSAVLENSTRAAVTSVICEVRKNGNNNRNQKKKVAAES